jgi:3-hydroxybutyryl-CoA dehydrogenase
MKIGVLGGGLMGSGIAQVAAQAGLPTVVREVSDAIGLRSRSAIERSLARGSSGGRSPPSSGRPRSATSPSPPTSRRSWTATS